ncbi:MAG: hypothetical protein IKC87_00730 [Clostridia bacterium]|nr:hypothetical protein [Clostridia bacterium]
MTGEIINKHTDKGKALRAAVSVGMILLLIGVAFFLSDSLGDYAREGMRLAVERVIPTTLPFMILSGMAVNLIDIDSLPILSRGFERAFGISRSAFGIFLIGNLTGFPIGAKMTADAYRSGRLDKESAERLLAYSDNPSFPFVIGVVGESLLGDIRLGVLLLASLGISTLLSAQLFRDKSRKMSYNRFITRQKYSFVESVKSAAASALTMTAFISFFFTLVGAVRDGIKNLAFRTLLMLPLEITGALSEVCTESTLPLPLRVALAGFALGFGGISVMLQVSAFSSEAELSMRKYFLIKICEGLVAAAVAGVVMLVIEL